MRFPGVGPKTSERLVFWLLQQQKSLIARLVDTLSRFQSEIHLCPICFNFTDNGTDISCALCADSRRDRTVLCVVADVMDLLALEATSFKGLYHVLGGVVYPLKGITLQDLRFKELVDRIMQSYNETVPIREVILAFDPNQEGELTCHYLKKALQALPHSLTITRLGRGLPQGGDLDFADEVTLLEALKGRREF